MKKILLILRGCLVISLVALITIPMAVITIFLGALAKISPKCLHYHLMSAALKGPKVWISLLQLIMKINSAGKWDIEGPTHLKHDGYYLLISNHVSWVDILLLSTYFNHRIPMIKFFMKKELKWSIPLVGLVCWLLEYPFMERHTPTQIKKNPALKGKDIETTREACRRLKERPTTLVNFVEGTRFRPEKHERQRSPYQHLLKPRAGGVAIVLEELHTNLNGIIDATIYFPGKPMSFWKFMMGDFSKLIMRYRLLPVTENLIGNYYENRAFRTTFQTWLNQVWFEKDALIQEIKKQHG